MRKSNWIVLAFVALCAFIVWLQLGRRSGPAPPGPAPRPTQGGTAGAMPPAGDAVTITFSSSDGKKEWVDAVTESFHRSGAAVNGKPVRVVVNHMRSGESLEKILAGQEKPTIWGAAGPSWITRINHDWQVRERKPFVEGVRPTVRTGLVLAMWEPMAQALGWPGKPIGWADLVRVATNPKGWAAYNHPEWGPFKFGHAHPDYSNSAMLSVISEIYAAAHKTSGLTVADVRKPEVVEAVTATERAIVHYGESSSWLIDKICTNGPAYLSAVTVYESSVIKANNKYPDKPFRLVAIYPKEGTFWETHPAGIVTADWVTPEQKEAAGKYLDYLTSPEQQARAPEFGFRPTRSGIPLTAPFDKEHGVDPGQTGKPELEYVSDDVFRRANELWHQVKKKATVYLVMDTSGSMKGQPMEAAKAGAAEFVRHLERDDELHAWVFNSRVVPLGEGGRAGQVAEETASRIRGLIANGSTKLYDAVAEAYTAAEKERRSRTEPRLYAVVVLSDGKDTDSAATKTDVLALIPKGEDAEGPRIFAIAYGPEADKDTLKELAEVSNGRMFAAGTEDIGKVYEAIAAYF
jgi:Ca-activated chloride channel family protein